MNEKPYELTALRVLVYASFPITVLLCVLVPFFLAHYGYQIIYAPMLWLMALAFLCAVWQLRGIVNLVAEGNPFARKNVVYLRRISWCCFAVALSALLMLLVYFSFLKVLIALVAVAGGLILRVLAYVFLLAARQKEEMDLTI